MNAGNLKKLFLLKLKYAGASAVATSVDYLLYLLLVFVVLGGQGKTVANFLSYPVGVLVNFLLQKRYIFHMRRRLGVTFAGAMLVSAGGWAINTTLFFIMLTFPFFDKHHLLAKVLVNAVVFFYNFYGKRYVFEKRFFEVDT